MRTFIVAITAALLALALVGCGGGEAEPVAVPTDGTAQEATTGADASVPASPAAQGAVFEEMPRSEVTPAAITSALDDDRPVMLLFFDGEQKVTNDLRSQINTVMDDNDGLIELHTYDLGPFASVDSEGVITADPEAVDGDGKGGATVAFARELGVTFAPTIVIVDSQGFVVFRHTGFIDAELLDRQVQRAAQ